MQKQEALLLVDEALVAHQSWSTHLHRRLIAGLPPAQSDVSPDAHEACALGRWYRHMLRDPGQGIASLPGFQAVGQLHEQMHAHARSLLLAPPGAQRLLHYDQFAGVSSQLAQALRVLQRELLTLELSLDPLTGLPGRRDMDARLSVLHARMHDEARPAAIVMMDVDHFKRVNDRHGHVAGDAVLAWIGACVRTHLRARDVVFRYGGEEFLAMLADSSLDDACRVLERLRETMAQARIELPGGGEVYITASFGVAACEPGVPVQEVVDRADRALYLAKQMGRNRVQVWTPGAVAA